MEPADPRTIEAKRIIHALLREHADTGHVDLATTRALAARLDAVDLPIEVGVLRLLVTLHGSVLGDLETVLRDHPEGGRLQECRATLAVLHAYLG